MAKKYYAVAVGKTPGIYFTWDDCKAQVDQFPGAVYKGFATIGEAESFYEEMTEKSASDVRGENRQLSFEDMISTGESVVGNSEADSGTISEKSDKKSGKLDGILDKTLNQSVSTDDCLIAYVDGSYEHSIGKYAYGCVMVLPDGPIELNGADDDEDYVSMRNVAGEILGSEKAILWAVEHGYREVIIYYDYEGIEKWANDIWKANKPGTIRYKQFVAEQREKIKISFRKVAAHTGVTYNEMADKLAKSALGL